MLGDEDALTAVIVALARKFGRYGYRRITDLLQMAGWSVNAKRVRRICVDVRGLEVSPGGFLKNELV